MKTPLIFFGILLCIAAAFGELLGLAWAETHLGVWYSFAIAAFSILMFALTAILFIWIIAKAREKGCDRA